MSDNLKLINNLKYYRTTKTNLTQEELASIVDCTRQTIIALEQNKYNPSLILALRLAKALDVPVDELFQIE
jgi:putative transcriptional regulator